MTIPITKIYVDTKFMTADSESSSNFKYQLPSNIFLPDDAVFQIDEISIPHSWYSIEEGINDKMYVKWTGTSGTTVFKKVTLASGQYDGTQFANVVLIALNAGMGSMPTNELVPSYNATQNTIFITASTNTTSFKIFSDYELKNGYGWLGTETDAVDAYNIQSVNDVIRNYGITPSFEPSSRNNTYTSGFLDLSAFHNIYISSPNLGGFASIGPRGESGIIRKVPVTSDFGYIIQEKSVTDYDLIECPKQAIPVLEFQLKDSRGYIIPLHGSNVSFSIVFKRLLK